MKNHLIAIALCGFGAAQATTLYNFSYEYSTGTLSGQLQGTLQGDNNTILVDSVLDFVKFNGTPGVSLPLVSSVTNLFGGSAPSIVSLNGIGLDFFACETICGDRIAFGGPIAYIPTAFVYLGASFGDSGGIRPYDPTKWHISAVPEPTSFALMGLGLAGLAWRQRRRPPAAMA